VPGFPTIFPADPAKKFHHEKTLLICEAIVGNFTYKTIE
jgi:hypothetical protein